MSSDCGPPADFAWHWLRRRETFIHWRSDRRRSSRLRASCFASGHVGSVSLLYERLGVSASGYHQHSVRKADQGPNKPVRRSIGNDALLAHIKAIHAGFEGEYGWARIWKELLARSIRVGKERVRTLMAQHGIRARAKRRFKATTDARHNLPVAPNLVARDFTPQAPNTGWSTDITYIDNDEGWLYLTVMLDLFSRQVVGWAIGPRMTKGLVLDALRMAWFRRSVR